MLAERQATFVVLYDFLKGHIFSLVYQPNLATDELAEFEEFRAKYLDDGLEEDTMPPLISDTNWEDTFAQYSDQEFLDLVLDITKNVIPIYGAWNQNQIENIVRIFTSVERVLNLELNNVAFIYWNLDVNTSAQNWGITSVRAGLFGAYRVHYSDDNYSSVGTATTMSTITFNDQDFGVPIYERWLIHEIGHHYDLAVLNWRSQHLVVAWGWGEEDNPIELRPDNHGNGAASVYPVDINKGIIEDFAEVFTSAYYYFEVGGGQAGVDNLDNYNSDSGDRQSLYVPNAIRRCEIETQLGVTWPYHLNEMLPDYHATACEEA
ncbi:MAG: hypothetical protein F9K28_11310 [Bacteroidetes bacterium]|nr:MAG: hypothetical protein F9K28_11310 [Bacteroidota bacterium]